jgi:hypothetical protein
VVLGSVLEHRERSLDGLGAGYGLDLLGSLDVILRIKEIAAANYHLLTSERTS